MPFDKSGAFHLVAEGTELRRLAVRGAAATVFSAALGLAAQIGSTVILARLLTPADFGVVAMVTTFSLLLMSFGSNGFHEVVIQRADINRYQASNLFWINCAAGLILAIGFAGVGSLLAQFYRNPLVSRVAVAVSPAIFVNATSVVHLALLKRGMRFAATATNDMIGRATYTVIGILFAVMGWGYWTLVEAILAQSIVMALHAFWLCRWIPTSPRRGVGTRSMLRFAAHVYGRFATNYFARNLDNLLVGWRFNATALGFYKKAYDLFALSASQLTAPLHDVALAALSRLQHDPPRLKGYLGSCLGVIAMIGMAIGADLTLVGKDLVRLVLGPQWQESGRIFQLFGPGIGIMLLYSTIGWIHLSAGEPQRWLRWTLLETLATATLFVMALPWGPAGIALAWSVSYWVWALPAFWYAGRPIGFGIHSLIAAVWRYITASVIAGVACAVLIQHFLTLRVAKNTAEALALTVAKSLLFTILYLSAVILLHQGFNPLLQVARLLREVLPVGVGPRHAYAPGNHTSSNHNEGIRITATTVAGRHPICTQGQAEHSQWTFFGGEL